MKITILAGLLLLAAAAGAAAQSFVAPLPQPPQVRVPKRVAPPPGIDGAVARAVHSGAPFEMISPFAPREYGGGPALVYYEESDPFQKPPHKNARAVGFKLFAFQF
jgi:hypothetical protein